MDEVNEMEVARFHGDGCLAIAGGLHGGPMAPQPLMVKFPGEEFGPPPRPMPYEACRPAHPRAYLLYSPRVFR